jgi:hypothetical protein
VTASSRESEHGPVLLPVEMDARRRRVNGPELALWFLGLALLVISAVLTYGFAQLIFREQTDTSGGVDLGFESAFAQSSEVFIAPSVTGAIVCIALAIFLRGLDVNARRRDAARAAAILAHAPREEVAVIEPESHFARDAPMTAGRAAASAAPRPVDYSAFMRPSDHPTDPHT